MRPASQRYRIKVPLRPPSKTRKAVSVRTIAIARTGAPLLGRRQIVLKYQNRHIVKVRGQSGLTLLIQHLHCARSLLRIELAYTYKQAAYRNNNSECPIAWTITEALSQRVFATAGGCIGAAVSLRADAGGRLGTLGGRLGLRRISHLIPLGELEGDGG